MISLVNLIAEFCSCIVVALFRFPFSMCTNVFFVVQITAWELARVQSDWDVCYTTSNRCKSVGLRQSDKILPNMNIYTYQAIRIACFICIKEIKGHWIKNKRKIRERPTVFISYKCTMVKIVIRDS